MPVVEHVEFGQDRQIQVVGLGDVLVSAAFQHSAFAREEQVGRHPDPIVEPVVDEYAGRESGLRIESGIIHSRNVQTGLDTPAESLCKRRGSDRQHGDNCNNNFFHDRIIFN